MICTGPRCAHDFNDCWKDDCKYDGVCVDQRLYSSCICKYMINSFIIEVSQFQICFSCTYFLPYRHQIIWLVKWILFIGFFADDRPPGILCFIIFYFIFIMRQDDT